MIADAIGQSITNGSLTEQDRLPPQRDLADELGVSLNTISRAYAEAIRRGFLCGEVGRGTYVRKGGPLPTRASQARLNRPTEGPIDFSLGLPAIGESADVLARTLDHIKESHSLSAYLDYQTAGDFGHHREAAASWMSKLAFEVNSDNIIITNGAQHGLLVALMAMMQPGDVLLTEALTYAPIKAVAQHLGLKLYPVAMDDDGLSPEALNIACQTTTAKVLYCMPTLHTPTTITMSNDRRQDIVRIARKHELTIIEDDVFGFLPPDRPAPIANFAPERTLFITSVSKSLAPGLRVGYLYAPSKHCSSLRAAVNLSCWMPPPLMAEIASLWIADGIANRLNDFQRTESHARQQLAKKILVEHSYLAEPFGFHLWLPLPEYWKADAFRAAAERQGVKLLTAETFAVAQVDAQHAVRLCLSHELTRQRVSSGLEIIAKLLTETSDDGLLVV